MPVGIIINVLSVAVGGLAGTMLKENLSTGFKDKMNMTFGCCSMAMGISSIILMKNMPAVVFAIIIGTVIGMAVHLGANINACGRMMQRGVSRVVKISVEEISMEEFEETLVTAIVLFCASGTGIYGSIVSGMTGDHSILIAKSVLDFFTAMIFACELGLVTCVIAIPQTFIFLILFYCAGIIFPLTTENMINDFKACGGFLMLATGFRMTKMKMFPTADMIPAMVFVMPVSWFWVYYIVPFLH